MYDLSFQSIETIFLFTKCIFYLESIFRTFFSIFLFLCLLFILTLYFNAPEHGIHIYSTKKILQTHLNQKIIIQKIENLKRKPRKEFYFGNKMNLCTIFLVLMKKYGGKFTKNTISQSIATNDPVRLN